MTSANGLVSHPRVIQIKMCLIYIWLPTILIIKIFLKLIKWKYPETQTYTVDEGTGYHWLREDKAICDLWTTSVWPPTYPHFPLPGAEVEIQTAFKPLVDKLAVTRNLPQAGEFLGQEVQVPLLGVLFLPRELLEYFKPDKVETIVWITSVL